jgi:hypothetical protein
MKIDQITAPAYGFIGGISLLLSLCALAALLAVSIPA